MPRSTSTNLANMLPAAITVSTVDIALRDGTTVYLQTGSEPLNLGGNDYLQGLIKVGELKETLGQPTNRVAVVVSNVDKQFGFLVADPTRKTELAEVTVRRFYRSLDDPLVYEWKHFFYGKAANVVVDERSVSFDVIADTTAAGTCIATETLSPNNGWVFPETPEPAPPGSGNNEIPPFDWHNADPNNL